jgi:hypothetical protein
MTTFAKLRAPEWGTAVVECIHNRELERPVDPELTYFVLSEEIREKFNIDYDLGEMLIYSPSFEPDMSCMWVAQTIDFDFTEH